MKFVLLSVFLAIFAHAALADDIHYIDALTLEQGYALGPPQGFPTWVLPPLGTNLTWVGRVSHVGEPFDDGLVPVGTEVTYVFQGSTCVLAENWEDDPCGNGVVAYYQNGTLTIYLDPTPDADFTNLASFSDGDVALSLHTFTIQIADDDPYLLCPPRGDDVDIIATIQVTGGLWADLVSTDTRGFYGSAFGEVDPSIPPHLDFMGYAFRAGGAINLSSTVATKSTTWGGVKALYR